VTVSPAGLGRARPGPRMGARQHARAPSSRTIAPPNGRSLRRAGSERLVVPSRRSAPRVVTAESAVPVTAVPVTAVPAAMAMPAESAEPAAVAG